MKGNDRLYNLRQIPKKQHLKKMKGGFKVSYKHQDSEEKLICLLCDNDTMSN